MKDLTGIVGVTSSMSDGADGFVRLSRSREVIVADARGRYAERTSRRATFSAMTSPAGTTVVTANNSPIAAGAATIFSIYNPWGSGINAEILKTWLSFISGTPAGGMTVYNQSFNQIVKAVPNNGNVTNSLPQSNIYGLTGKVLAFTQTSLTGSIGSQSLLRPIVSTATSSVVATTPYINILDVNDGDIVIPQGGILSIATPATGSSQIIAAGMSWMEIPIL